ncbi:SDR family oxidoreductase [Bacillus sp. V2I10]|uniref:SDR family oxidoreductase n=1 Tax=Bacillus sp. V2I10 TaxID=3042276 RepID=UPI003593E3AC
MSSFNCLETLYGNNKKIFKRRQKAYQSSILLQHMGTPENIARTVAYLTFEDSDYITGQSIPVKGGNTFGFKK